MRTIPLLLLCVLQDRAERFFERITFGKVEPASDEERRVLGVLLKKEHWIEAVRVLEEKIGPFQDGLTVRVGFDWPEDDYAHGGSGEGGGWIRFNLGKLVEYQKKVDQLEKQRREEEAKGRRLVFRVPPARFERMIWHELTHVLQGGLRAPDWFKEGMAVWVSEDPNCLLAFAAAGKKVGSVEATLPDRNETYARGHLFWKWLDSRGLARKVAGATVIHRKAWRSALEEGTGMEWEKLSAQEEEWSVAELEKTRTRAK
jgi:hypothetical protein